MTHTLSENEWRFIIFCVGMLVGMIIYAKYKEEKDK